MSRRQSLCEPPAGRRSRWAKEAAGQKKPLGKRSRRQARQAYHGLNLLVSPGNIRVGSAGFPIKTVKNTLPTRGKYCVCVCVCSCFCCRPVGSGPWILNSDWSPFGKEIVYIERAGTGVSTLRDSTVIPVSVIPNMSLRSPWCSIKRSLG